MIMYRSGRMYTSFKNPSIEVEYISEILDGGTNVCFYILYYYDLGTKF